MLETKPVGMATRNNFYNFCIAFESSLTPSELKRQLNKIEIIMGRDRKDENRSEKDRPMDLDIAYRTDAANPTLPPMDFEIEPWVRPLLDDLFQYVGLLAESPTLKQEFLREVVVENTKVGQRPTTLPSNAPDFSETDE
jgi:7,8-dihydro-6-hydroxymethylpterin-pyrophosphokinase